MFLAPRAEALREQAKIGTTVSRHRAPPHSCAIILPGWVSMDVDAVPVWRVRQTGKTRSM